MKIAKAFICLCFSVSVGASRVSINRVIEGKDKCCCREVRPGHLGKRCSNAPHTRYPESYFRLDGEKIRSRELILGTEQKLYCCKAREECVFKFFGAKHDIPVERINPDRESATCAIGTPRTSNTRKFYKEFKEAVVDVQPNRANIIIGDLFQVHASAIPHNTKTSLRFMLVEKSTDEEDREYFAPEFNASSQVEDFAHGKALPRLDLQRKDNITTWEEEISFQQAHVNEYSRIMITQTTYSNWTGGKRYGDVFCKVPQTLSFGLKGYAVSKGIDCTGLFIMRKSKGMLHNAFAEVPLYKGDASAYLTGPRVYTADPRSTRRSRNRESRRNFWASQALACAKIPAEACLKVRRAENPPIDPIRLCQQFFEMTPNAHIEAFLHICDEPVDRKDALSWGMMPGMPNGAWPDEDEEPEPSVNVKFASPDSKSAEYLQVEQELKLAENLDDVDDFEEDLGQDLDDFEHAN